MTDDASADGALDWAALTDQVHQASLLSFTRLLEAHPEETFYAFCLYTDGDGWTIVPSANSEEGFARHAHRAPTSQAYYRWPSSEWAYEAEQASQFNATCRTLREADSGASIVQFRRQVVAVLTEALRRLREDEPVRTLNSTGRLSLFVTMTDDDEAEAIEDASARVLNPPELVTGFLARYA